MSEISSNSRRIAKNTFLLYFRMLLMMFIGLFTSRVVLQQLGVEDYGVWTAVGGVVMIFTMVTDCVSGAIHRFLSYELGLGDNEKLRKAFSSGLIVQIALTIILVLFVLFVGQWFLDTQMDIPISRMDSARTVLYCSLGILALSMLSVPYNASIIAHEKMSAFAFLSIVEAVLKLAVAFALSASSFDKLSIYALLMLIVALVVRSSYIIYCRHFFSETRGMPVFDKAMLKEMSSFAGWSFIGSGATALNNHGLNLLINIFFGVATNAARGIASQVENIVRQFVNNFLTALNPQITKSWAASDKDYCFELVRKGSKFSMLVILLFLVPLFVDAENVLHIWLGTVPDFAPQFVRLTIIALLIEMGANSLMILQLATGNVKRFYLYTGLISLLCLPCVWIAFKSGLQVYLSYIILIACNFVVFIVKLLIVNHYTSFPIIKFIKSIIIPISITACISLTLTVILDTFIQSKGALHFVLVCLISWVSIAFLAYFLLLTKSEKQYLKQIIIHHKI